MATIIPPKKTVPQTVFGDSNEEVARAAILLYAMISDGYKATTSQVFTYIRMRWYISTDCSTR